MCMATLTCPHQQMSLELQAWFILDCDDMRHRSAAASRDLVDQTWLIAGDVIELYGSSRRDIALGQTKNGCVTSHSRTCLFLARLCQESLSEFQRNLQVRSWSIIPAVYIASRYISAAICLQAASRLN